MVSLETWVIREGRGGEGRLKAESKRGSEPKHLCSLVEKTAGWKPSWKLRLPPSSETKGFRSPTSCVLSMANKKRECRRMGYLDF